MNLSPTSTGNQHPNHRHAPVLAWLLTITVCGYFALAFLYSALANYWPGPFVDYWIDIPNVEKFFNGQLTFHDLVSAHANVHRLFIPRLLFIADYRFFSGTNVLLVWASLVCKIVTLLLFNHIIKNRALTIRLLLNTVLFAAIFNAANISNVLHNSNMQWDLASVFACLAIYFYSRDVESHGAARLRSLGWAWLFFAGGFLSQAGALPVIFVFVLISALNKKWQESFINLMLVIVVLYLTFVVLPVNEPQNPTYEGAVAMMIFKLKYVALYVFKMFSGSIYPLEQKYFIFSWIMLILLVSSLCLAHKTRRVYNNVFLSIAVFAFLMMIIIAAARVDFSPNTWPANRYQTNVLLFILSLGLHAYFSAAVWFGDRYRVIFQNIILAFSLASLFIIQYYLANYAVIFSNKVFSAQTYMLAHGVNQNNGADLLPSLQERDRIAVSDPFMQSHGFAWYANKQAGDGFYQKSKNIGDAFLPTGDETRTQNFSNSCPLSLTTTEYRRAEDGQGFAFSTPLRLTGTALFRTLLHRNTYYVLDDHALVIGFSTLLVDTDHQYSKATLEGYVTSQTATTIAEIDNKGLPACLFLLDKNNSTP